MSIRRLSRGVRCYAELVDDQWQAFCVDFTLAAQADTLEEAKQKLHAQIADYVSDACTVDAEHLEALLNRRAPIGYVAKFYWCSLLQSVRQGASIAVDAARSEKEAFRENLHMPLAV
ncbi:MAG: DUF1902 domain-containing protein [Pseudomonadota bacterium]|nr:DUF1902 domain-containing protein [Pseudomonadota bacterium]